MRWAAWQLAWDSVRIVGLINRTLYTSRAAALTQSLGLPLQPSSYAEFIHLFNTGALEDLMRLDHTCERMAAGLLALAESLGLDLQVTERPI
jgi:hypothetical protein